MQRRVHPGCQSIFLFFASLIAWVGKTMMKDSDRGVEFRRSFRLPFRDFRRNEFGSKFLMTWGMRRGALI